MSELKHTPPPVSLTTDFGNSDWFVGVMKGIIASQVPGVNLIDITHQIEPGNIQQAAFVLHQALPWFAKGSIHLAVIDPGVGTDRSGLVIETDSGYLVGPDNGLFSWVLQDLQIRRIIALDPSAFGHPISQTFHGRDLFAPAAARLAGGEDPGNWGEQRASIVRLDWPQPTLSAERLQGQVLHVDHFGNLITNVPIDSWGNPPSSLKIRRHQDQAQHEVILSPTYGLASDQVLAWIPGSTGYWELAVKQGNAATHLGWKAGTTFDMTW